MLPPGRTYTEFPSFADGIRCTWQRRSHAGDRPLIVPDGCVDLIDASAAKALRRPDCSGHEAC